MGKMFGVNGNSYCAGLLEEMDFSADIKSSDRKVLFIDLSWANVSSHHQEELERVAAHAAEQTIPIFVYIPSLTSLHHPVVRIASVVLLAHDELAAEIRKVNKSADVSVVGPYLSQIAFNPIGFHKQATDEVVLLHGAAIEDCAASIQEFRSFVTVATDTKDSAFLDDLIDVRVKREFVPPRAILTAEKMHATTADFLQTVLKALFLGIPIAVLPSRNLEESLGYQFATPIRSKVGAERFLKVTASSADRERMVVRLRRQSILSRSTATLVRHLARSYLNISYSPTVSVVCSTKRIEALELIGENLRRQACPLHEAVVVLHGGQFDQFSESEVRRRINFEPLTVLRKGDDVIFGDCLNSALEYVTGRYFTKFDDDDFYGPDHLLDLLAAHDYSRADIVGKWAHEVYFKKDDMSIDWCLDKQEEFGDHLPGATIFMLSELIKEMKFDSVSRAIDTALFKRIERRKGKLYSTHRFNFTRVRHDDHTFDRDLSYFLKYSTGEKRSGNTFSKNTA